MSGRVVAASLACLSALLIGACGTTREAARRPPASIDDAFLVRYERRVETGMALARVGVSDGRSRAVRELARAIAAGRQGMREALRPLRARVPADLTELADLGVSSRAAAEDLTPRAVEGVEPFDPAFLVTMRRDAKGALALLDAEVRLGRDPEVRALAKSARVVHADQLQRIDRALSSLKR